MALIPSVHPGDWDTVDRNFKKIVKFFIGPDAIPNYTGLVLSGLTASRLVATDADKALASSDLASWVTGTANEIDITDDGDGTITVGIVNPLIASKGGTGLATITDHGLMLGSGTGAVTVLAEASNGQLPIGSTGADPVLATLTGTAKRVIVTNAAGSITLSGPQDLDTVDSPTFAGGTFTAVVTGVTPTAGTHLATKEYVDLALGARKSFFLSDTASGVGALEYAYPHETGEAEATIVTAGMGAGAAQLINGWITEAGQPATTTLHEGTWSIHIHAKKGAANHRITTLYAVISTVDADGTSNKTTVATSEVTAELTDTETAYTIHAAFSGDVEVAATSRLICDIYANVTTGALDSVVTLYLEGEHDSYFTSKVDSGIWQNHGDVLDDFNTLGAVASDGQIIVGTGAGAFAYESGATARASLGLAIGTNVQAWDASLDSIAALTYASDSFIKVTAEDTYAIRTLAEVKTDLSLNLVENTAVSTWVGTTNITTLGTIATGTWEATDVGIAHGGTGQSTAQAAINALSAVSGATNEHVLTKDTGTGNATWKAAAGGVSTWIALTDTDPANYTGDAGKYVKVNAGETGLEFGSPTPGAGDEYVDRGDPAGYDYTVASFTTDATWRDLDLSAIVGSQVCLVHIILRVSDDALNSAFLFREKGNSNVYNKCGINTEVANGVIFADCFVLTNSSGVIEYYGSNTTFTAIDVVIRGWFVASGSLYGKAKVDSGATADYIGAASNDGVLRTGAGLSYADGGDYVTLAVDVGIADDKIMQVDDADAADDDYAKFTANGLEGRSYAEVLGDLSGQAAAAFSFNTQNLTAVGTIGCGVVTGTGAATFEGASVTVGKASTTTGTLVLHDSNSANTITLTVPDISAGSLSFTLPPTDGENTNVLQTDGNGVLTWVAAGASNHAILDGSVHSDSVADAVTRGSIIYGNATPKWDELVIGAADTFLGSDGTDLSYRTAAQVMASLSGEAAAAFDLNGQDLTNGGVIFLTEQAAAEAHVAGKGQFWVKTATPNEPWFDNDAGTEIPLDNRYVDRGDPAAFDRVVGDFTTDGTWRDLDLGPGGLNIVPANAVAINIFFNISDDVVGNYVAFRKNGNSNAIAFGGLRRVQISNQAVDCNCTCACDSSGVIEYFASNTTWTAINFVVLGWWLA